MYSIHCIVHLDFSMKILHCKTCKVWVLLSPMDIVWSSDSGEQCPDSGLQSTKLHCLFDKESLLANFTRKCKRPQPLSRARILIEKSSGQRLSTMHPHKVLAEYSAFVYFSPSPQLVHSAHVVHMHMWSLQKLPESIHLFAQFALSVLLWVNTRPEPKTALKSLK